MSLGNALRYHSPTAFAPLLEDIVRQTGAAVVFPDYTLAPDKQYPYQFDEVYGILDHFVSSGSKYDLQTDSLVLAGDSAGGKSPPTLIHVHPSQALIIEQDTLLSS